LVDKEIKSRLVDKEIKSRLVDKEIKSRLVDKRSNPGWLTRDQIPVGADFSFFFGKTNAKFALTNGIKTGTSL
jgi:hypothetical protein